MHMCLIFILDVLEEFRFSSVMFQLMFDIIIIIIIYYNNWNLYSAISIHKMFKSAAHCHSLSHSQQRLNGRAREGVF